MTGQCTVRYALEKGLASLKSVIARCLLRPPHFIPGFVVRMLYRTEATIPDSIKGKVELVQGDVTVLADVKKTLEGVDCVSVVLGTRNQLQPTKVLSTGMDNILTAMKEAGLRRVSVCLSSFLFFEPGKVPKQFDALNGEHKAMLVATKASDLDYIAVLPPHIEDSPKGQITVLHDKSPGRVVSKLNLAEFLIDSLDMAEHYGQTCGIAFKV